ncbi:hypothetical protein EYF80_041144 [Liparis tanakae]|uniref:Uncharacterized protein n=1 Tax=Liparis tanakae TaxID=230148 RepID=A0A4Z2G5X4_9TELE|nr:hypothetical protein EYF80_041144 [Liparis tanakae]
MTLSAHQKPLWLSAERIDLDSNILHRQEQTAPLTPDTAFVVRYLSAASGKQRSNNSSEHVSSRAHGHTDGRKLLHNTGAVRENDNRLSPKQRNHASEHIEFLSLNASRFLDWPFTLHPSVVGLQLLQVEQLYDKKKKNRAVFDFHSAREEEEEEGEREGKRR